MPGRFLFGSDNQLALDVTCHEAGRRLLLRISIPILDSTTLNDVQARGSGTDQPT